jgi:hypothetical protein
MKYKCWKVGMVGALGVLLAACSGEAQGDFEIATTQQALTGNKLAVTLLAAPGWNQPSRLLDGSTSTKSTHGSATASIELSLDAQYTLTTVRVAEDNAGSQNVDAFGIQCWNGSSYSAELFRELNTLTAVPGFNEHVITGTSCTTNRVKVNLYNNAALEAFEIELYGSMGTPPPPVVETFLVDASSGPGGTLYPSSTEINGYVNPILVDGGSDFSFHFMPDPGYRVAQICTPEYDQCFPFHDTDYTVRDVTGDDRIFWVGFEEVSAAAVQIPVTVRPGSTLATPAAVVDANVTTTKSTGPSVSYIDLDLDAYYEITGLQVFEDNGAWEVDAYGLQCWTGYSWGSEIRVASANLVKPVANEYFIAEPSCRTNRVRVSFYNNGTVEVFGVKVFGIHRNMFHGSDKSIPLGSYRSAIDGSWVYSEAFLNHQDPYVEQLHDSNGTATPPWESWIYVEGAAFNAYGDLRSGSVTLEGVYVRHCRTGEWTAISETSYAPAGPQFSVSGEGYTLYFQDIPDVEDGFPDPDYDCPLSPRDDSSVLYNGVETPIIHNGEVTFAYVVTHH